jgi:hypothetical protein
MQNADGDRYGTRLKNQCLPFPYILCLLPQVKYDLVVGKLNQLDGAAAVNQTAAMALHAGNAQG